MSETRNISTGLPTSEKEYEERRQALKEPDVELRVGANEELSEVEKAANQRLVTLRDGLLTEYRKSMHFPPSEPFYKVKEEIEGTDLFRFLVDIPKGGLLHVHVFSTAPCDWILEHGLREPGCYVCWPKGVDEKNIVGQLEFFKEGQQPEGYRPAVELLEEDPDFSEKLRQLLMSCGADESLPDLDAWAKFNQIFQRLMHFTTYHPIFERYYRFAFRRALEDHIDYIELRANFIPLYDLDGGSWNDEQIADLYWQIREEIRAEYSGFDLKIIYSGVRAASEEDVWTVLEKAVALRERFKDRNFIIGFDLVGEEDAGHTTGHFLPEWVKLSAFLEEKGATLPLYFHDGESDWPQDENLYDAYLLGSCRIGHGFNLFRFPGLEERLKKDGIALEVCPISNQILRYVADMRLHPASGYIARGLPIVLNNDDPGIFGNDGLSYDLWEAVVAWNLDLTTLKVLLRNSLTYSGMNDEEKTEALAHWNAAWLSWAETIAAQKEGEDS